MFCQLRPAVKILDIGSKQCRPRSDCSFRSSLISVYTVCNSICFFWMHYSIVKPDCSIFRTHAVIISGVPILWIFYVSFFSDFSHLYKCTKKSNLGDRLPVVWPKDFKQLAEGSHSVTAVDYIGDSLTDTEQSLTDVEENLTESEDFFNEDVESLTDVEENLTESEDFLNEDVESLTDVEENLTESEDFLSEDVESLTDVEENYTESEESLYEDIENFTNADEKLMEFEESLHEDEESLPDVEENLTESEKVESLTDGKTNLAESGENGKLN